MVALVVNITTLKIKKLKWANPPTCIPKFELYISRPFLHVDHCVNSVNVNFTLNLTRGVFIDRIYRINHTETWNFNGLTLVTSVSHKITAKCVILCPKTLLLTEKQLHAIQFFVATRNVCPLAIPNSCAQNMSIRLLENHSFDPLNPSSLSTYGLFVLSEDYESDFKFRRSLFFILTCFVTYGNFLDTKLTLTMLSSSTWLKKVILPIFEILLPFILISEFFKINVIYHYLYLQIMDSICWSFDSINKVFSHIQIFFHWKNSFVSTYKYIGNILFISICC